MNRSATAARYDAPTAWLSKIVVVWTMVVLVAGSLVTGYKAALSDPTWPTFVGHWYPVYWVGGLMYEDSHRLTVSILSFGTLALVVMIVLRDGRPAMRKLAWWTFALLIAQALVGAVIIKWLRPVEASMLHASAGQLFFCAVTAVALCLSKGWFRLGESAGRAAAAAANEPHLGAAMAAMRRLTTACACLTFLQIVLGSGVRHGDDRVHHTTFWVFLVAHLVTWTAIVFTVGILNGKLRDLGEHDRPLRFGINAATGLVLFQLVLGAFSFFANRARLEENTPHPEHVAVSSLHLLVGGILLATFLVQALRAWRLYPPAGEAAPPARPLPATASAAA